MIAVVAAALFICFVATIYPSRQASKLDPAQALGISNGVHLKPRLDKSYVVGSSRLTVLRSLDLSWRRARWSRSSAPPAWEEHAAARARRARRDRRRLGADRDVDLPAMRTRGLTAYRNRHVGFVFQFHHLLPEFTALENAGCRCASRGAGGESAAARRGVAAAGRPRTSARAQPGMLSGGEQQRVAIARALVMEPSLLLADEPTGDLDEHTAESLHDLLREMHRERGLTSIIATHNPRLAAACDRVLRSKTEVARDALSGTVDHRATGSRR